MNLGYHIPYPKCQNGVGEKSCFLEEIYTKTRKLSLKYRVCIIFKRKMFHTPCIRRGLLHLKLFRGKLYESNEPDSLTGAAELWQLLNEFGHYGRTLEDNVRVRSQPSLSVDVSPMWQP